EDASTLIVPAITLYEVFKRVYQQRGEGDALTAVAGMLRGMAVDLHVSLALEAARVSLELKLPMADSIILTSARLHNATLRTQDSDCRDIPDVRFFEKTDS